MKVEVDLFEVDGDHDSDYTDDQHQAALDALDALGDDDDYDLDAGNS